MTERARIVLLVRRFGGWTPLRAAVARQLGVRLDEVVERAVAGDAPVWLEARTQRGDFAVRVELAVDPARMPRDVRAFTAALSRELGEDMLCAGGEDGPGRWILVQPDGHCFSVVERTPSSDGGVVIDRRVDPRPLWVH